MCDVSVYSRMETRSLKTLLARLLSIIRLVGSAGGLATRWMLVLLSDMEACDHLYYR